MRLAVSRRLLDGGFFTHSFCPFCTPLCFYSQILISFLQDLAFALGFVSAGGLCANFDPSLDVLCNFGPFGSSSRKASWGPSSQPLACNLTWPFHARADHPTHDQIRYIYATTNY
jgi:hypothetical protein